MKTALDHMGLLEAIPPRAGNAAVVGDYVSMKNIGHLSVIVQIKQAGADPVVCEIVQATAVAGTGVKALGTAVPVSANLDTATSDAMVAQTADDEFTTDVAVKNKIVHFDILPEHLDVNGGFDCIAVKVTSVAAGDIISALYQPCGQRYLGQSVIVD